MSYVYTVNGIGLKIVFFASKRAALNYAHAHNLPKLRNGHYGIVRARTSIATLVREEFDSILEEKNITEKF